ncbi:DUF3817 domain-containing protein [bacterium]|nr:DUF3817 domain-containing protein [bacterium]
MGVKQNKTMLGALRIISFLEGISLLVLVGIAMPLKYYFNNPEPVRFVGMAHGVLFLIFIVNIALVQFYLKWSFEKSIKIFLTSFIPFGMIYADRKLLRE